MELELKAKVGIYITSYEIDNKNKASPTLSHIFWGDTLKDALSIAKSHLISDVFFSSSFTGTLKWGGDQTLYITHDGELLNSRGDIKKVLKELKARAKIIKDKQNKSGIIQSIQVISK